ncbi:hypothetical protein JCM3765_001933 [Sporobolomyces pararoseus]
MVATRTVLSAFTFLAAAVTSSSAQILDLNLDLGLLQDGALVTADLFLDALTDASCPDGNVGIIANVLNLVRVCGCVSLLNPGPGQSVCPECPANAEPLCGRGSCTCGCSSGFVSDTTTGSCIPDNACTNSGGLSVNNQDGTFTCNCLGVPGTIVSSSTGVCVLAPSARARRRNFVFNTPSYPFTSGGDSAKFCPRGETACPNGNSFECVDTRDSLTACGGCPGQGGEDCLSIPGALNVQCANSRCQVSSCFAGYTLNNGRCI